ncbi:MAG TPA: glutaredoxin family protein [Legionellales bacterium]|nr:glutaredoxin family protein [Legionellales bacterium]HCA89462.1 glutaredoxin family protein [Legionellales bacterium]|tara:strand:+ start:14961 stop:15695 length:735 start_codon:yes stop_codon:yes gene_type:complete
MTQEAHLYRLATQEHICPFGLKARALLKRQGYKVIDHKLTSREQADKFKSQHEVGTTPQIFIENKRIGGYEALRAFLNLPVTHEKSKTYQPIIAIFGTTLLMASSLMMLQPRFTLIAFMVFFVALSMCVLGVMKLRDLEAFSHQFLGYDLLAQHWIFYAYLYPFIETLAGIGMLSNTATFFTAPIALIIGLIGSISVIKAVYIDKRELSCACVGGNSQVPLGFISLTENLMMVTLSTWMLSRLF